MKKLRSLRAIAQIRDPRDCLTSQYFSEKESHTPPPDPEKAKLFFQRRKEISEMGIDKFVLDLAGNYKRRMEVISEIIDGHDDILILKYEDMTTDTEKWLGQISDFLDQPITDQLQAKLTNKTRFSVDVEDSSKHKRQITPGDHRRKLKPETIARLDDMLGDELRRFDYLS